MADDHDPIIDQYLDEIERWATPEEIRRLLRAFKSPEDVLMFRAELQAILDEKRSWTWLRKMVKDAGAYVIVIGGAISTLAAAWLWFGK